VEPWENREQGSDNAIIYSLCDLSTLALGVQKELRIFQGTAKAHPSSGSSCFPWGQSNRSPQAPVLLARPCSLSLIFSNYFYVAVNIEFIVLGNRLDTDVKLIMK